MVSNSSIFHPSAKTLNHQKQKNWDTKIITAPFIKWKKWFCNAVMHFNPIALRKAKIVYNFGLSECNTVINVDGTANRVDPTQTAPLCLILTASPAQIYLS